MVPVSVFSRLQRRKKIASMASEARRAVATLPDHLTEIPRERWPADPPALNVSPRLRAWASKAFIVQEFAEPSAPRRLSISRTAVDRDGRWVDGITWDEIQAIKAAVGYGAWCAIEVYPPDDKVVNVANVRHIWLVPTPAWIWGT